jgi:hypothetical protein
MIDYNVPFFANTPDNTHCFQASLKMVLKYFLPKEEYSFKELEEKTAKIEGLWTWPFAGMLWLKEKGFIVEDIEVFNYREFAENGEKYLLEFYTKEVAEAQIIHGDIPTEARRAKDLVEKIHQEVRLPKTEEIIDFLNKGHLVICNVNSKTLNGKIGYSGHFIVVKGYDETSLIIHDPGLPGQENRKVHFDLFEKAWAYPDEKAKNIMAFKLKN